MFTDITKEGQRWKIETKSFFPSETIYIRKSDKESQWIPGIVESKLGDYTYLIRLDNNQTVRRHSDHIRSGFREVVPDKNDNDWPDFSFKDNSCDDTAPIVATAGLRRSIMLAILQIFGCMVYINWC